MTELQSSFQNIMKFYSYLPYVIAGVGVVTLLILWWTAHRREKKSEIFWNPR